MRRSSPLVVHRRAYPLDREDEAPPEAPFRIDPVASRWIFLGMLGVVAGGILGYTLLKPAPAPAPAGIAGDPLLVQGREIYLERCVACHGTGGKGDGPTAKYLPGPPPGNLTDAEWKHGDAPDQVERVIDQGVQGTSMPSWGTTLGPDGVRATSAFVYSLAGRPVPIGLRGR